MRICLSPVRDSKAVTITSYLSSETLGKYAEKYPGRMRTSKSCTSSL